MGRYPVTIKIYGFSRTKVAHIIKIFMWQQKLWNYSYKKSKKYIQDKTVLILGEGADI